jgi:pSer/pThr/pTyr-binding forkhead associated (FHA) protein
MPVVPCHLMIGRLSVAVPLKKQVVLGRADAATGWMPDVDLTPYGGTHEAGVSRTHAQFIWQGKWVIEDLNSTNGTFLRGQRLFPGTRTPINNGELFQIGKLQITFFAQ